MAASTYGLLLALNPHLQALVPLRARLNTYGSWRGKLLERSLYVRTVLRAFKFLALPRPYARFASIVQRRQPKLYLSTGF